MPTVTASLLFNIYCKIVFHDRAQCKIGAFGAVAIAVFTICDIFNFYHLIFSSSNLPCLRIVYPPGET